MLGERSHVYTSPLNPPQPADKRYTIAREPYRTPVTPNPDEKKKRPDVVVIRLLNIQIQQGLTPLVAERDVLWIECKAPNLNAPYGWKTVLFDAVDRLAVAYDTRRVYLILAVGLRWLPFLWDPAVVQNPPLHILDNNGAERWAVDPRVHPVPQAALAGQTHYIDSQSGLAVDTKAAYSLDYWTLKPNQSRQNMVDMQLLEGLFCHIRIAPFQGINPEF